MYNKFKNQWFSNIKGDSISALVVALALIPEAIAFSLIAGVDPKVGLYASFCIATISAFLGGRPAMISAATGAMALLMVNLVKDYGLEYLLVATLLTGVLQIFFAYLGIAKLMSFVSKSVVVGFVNALAILIFLAQLPELAGANISVYLLVLSGLGIIYLFPYLPKIGKLIPSPLITIICLSLFVYFGDLNVRNVGDMGNLPDSLPVFLLPDVAFNLNTLAIVFPYSLALAFVGLLESFMTTTIVDDLTGTIGDKKQEAKGQGVANIVAGFFGGMAGCAMIGQSVINVKSGGRTRLSTLLAGIYLILFVVFLSDLISLITMPALVAVMIMVSIGTFDWKSVFRANEMPFSSNIVMLVTVFLTIFTHNLAYGVISGVLVACVFFVYKISCLVYFETSYNKEKTQKTYNFFGQIFFNSADKFYKSFDFSEVIDEVVINLKGAHFWDVSAVNSLDKVIIRLTRQGTKVLVIGQSEATKTIFAKFAVFDKPDEIKKIIKGQ